MEQANIGIEESYRKEIADGLSKLLADSYTLYLKTHNFHWNVTGPMFATLHKLFMEQYIELHEAVDVIAERIRALGAYAPASYTDFARLTSIEEAHDKTSAREMIVELLDGHEAVTKTARGVFPRAERGQDQATIDLLTKRMEVHEKTAWMLRSMLSD